MKTARNLVPVLAILFGVLAFYAFCVYATEPPWASRYGRPHAASILVNVDSCTATSCEGVIVVLAEPVGRDVEPAQWKERRRWQGDEAKALSTVVARGCVVDDGTRPSGFPQPIVRCVDTKKEQAKK